jgi:hypothetical protein
LFTCWASPLTLTAAGMPGRATHHGCVDGQVAAATGTHTVGRLQVQAVDAKGSTARTTGSAGAAGAAATTEGAIATASVGSARIVLGANVVEFGAIAAEATVTCTYDANRAGFSFAGRSSVASVRVNGRPVAVRAGANEIRVGGGVLRLNHAEVTATALTQHAVMFDTARAHLVLGESGVAIAPGGGNPCRPGAGRP